jgi:hypothetical protein
MSIACTVIEQERLSTKPLKNNNLYAAYFIDIIVAACYAPDNQQS